MGVGAALHAELTLLVLLSLVFYASSGFSQLDHCSQLLPTLAWETAQAGRAAFAESQGQAGAQKHSCCSSAPLPACCRYSAKGSWSLLQICV